MYSKIMLIGKKSQIAILNVMLKNLLLANKTNRRTDENVKTLPGSISVMEVQAGREHEHPKNYFCT